MKIIAKWSNSPIEWQQENRQRVNMWIDKFHYWQGCNIKKAKELLKWLEIEKIYFQDQPGLYIKDIQEMMGYIKEFIDENRVHRL